MSLVAITSLLIRSARNKERDSVTKFVILRLYQGCFSGLKSEQKFFFFVVVFRQVADKEDESSGRERERKEELGGELLSVHRCVWF